ncbi:LPD29 domain-containing protein [Phenylobacterium sp.]|uniref:LPD29 domain-containing protein n=1 Tax=Phenylobacterium sp. TaxID=1871053 RepID=UPI002DE24277|nr:LPD29 domain-containing protein [Phenylobacterium sp.]
MAKVVNHPAAVHAETRYLSCAETAKLIRTALKEAFPAVKFSVRSDTYSGGASIHVTYTDGPAVADVERIANTFQGGYFDGMTDYKGGHVHALASAPNEPVHFGADFVFVRQEISDPHRAATLAALALLTDLERNHLEARLRIGEFATPFHMDRGDHAYVRAVCVATLPPAAAKPSPTAEGVRLVRSY